MQKYRNKNRLRLSVETLEDRCTPASFGVAWAAADRLTLSFVPDGTNVDGHASTLFQSLGSQSSTSVWQSAILRALQTWAAKTDINIGVVADGGQPLGATGPVQGDNRFGDIRVAAWPMGLSGPLAVATPYDPVAGTRAGDIILNSSLTFGTASSAPRDLFTVVLHEAGHALGLEHSDDPASAMYESYVTTRAGLGGADLSQIQALYGARSADRYEGPVGDNTPATAALMKQPNIAGTITSSGDVDFYRFVIPTYANKSVTFKVQTSGLSALTARLSIYTTSGQLVSSSAAADPLTGDVSIRLDNVKRGTVFLVKVEGARTDVFGVGGYRLKIDSGAVSQAQIAALDIMLNGVSTSLVNDRHSNDTVATATRLDQSAFAVDDRFNYSINATLSDTSDVDFYSLITPAVAPKALLLTVNAGQGSVLNPQISVYDAAGNQVDVEILTNDAGSFVAQIVNPVACAKYFVQVTPDDFAAAGNLTGTYLLGVNFRDAAIVLETLVDDTLSAGNVWDVYDLQSMQVQLYHFVLSVDTDGSVADIAVRMNLYDENGVIVLSMDVHDGETLSSNFALKKAKYTARFFAASKSGAAISTVNYTLLGTALTDPLDPIVTPPTDPTLPPAPPPAPIVVTAPPPPPVAPPISNPWLPPPPPPPTV